MNGENRFNKPPLPPPDLVYRTRCHPEAMGRQPQPGEQFWTFRITLEDGRILDIQAGRQFRGDFLGMLRQEDADDVVERLIG